MSDLFNMMTSGKSLDIDEEYYELAKAFSDKFGLIVPKEMIPPSITDEQLKNAIRQCLETNNKDILKQLGIETSKDVLY